MVTGNTAALIAAQAMSPTAAGSGVTQEDLEKRRAEARKIVAQIEAQQRAAEAQYREYQRQKAEYERRVAEKRRNAKLYQVTV